MKKLITKLFTETITEEEIAELHILLNNPKNQEILESFVRDYYDLNLVTLKNDVDAAYKKVHNVIETKDKPVRRVSSYWKYAVAASIVLLISLTFIFNKDNTEFIEPIIVNNNIKPGHDKATLTLESGEEVTLVKGTSFQTLNATSNGEAIIYDNNTSRELVYNHLTIPRGGQFQLTLSDGTQVWLNSETQLKYPVSFIDGECRQVELVYGEAYFDVSPSTEHKGSKFKVFNNAQEIEVLGTEFNIKAYKDETNIYTTLVEGKVSVKTVTANKILSPNQQLDLDIINNNMAISMVDVYSHISWKDGIFNFKKKKLVDIMKVLSRWYDMDVQFKDNTLKTVTFTGAVRKHQSIEEILSAIKSSTINNYQIHDKTIIIE